jgi:hypothetical protein
MDKNEIEKRAKVLSIELKNSILKKLEKIRENIVLEKGSTDSSYLQMLLLLNDELDDVLLNWEHSSVDPRFSPFSLNYDLDDFDED